MENKVYYLLFSGWAARVYEEEGFSVLVNSVKMGTHEMFSVYRHDPTKDSPLNLLSAFQGYEGWAEITAGEYETLSNVLNK
jgi:hypothetical protein